MRKIGLDEQHAIILDIAKEFDKVCTKYQIPYYMLGGTMLGAIRHKGFIPWDDDMDFGIPRPYYQFAIEKLSKELPKPYRCCTYKNHPGCLSPFIKIENSNTVIEDPRVPLPLDKQLGLNIDVFPLDYCNPSDDIYNLVLKRQFWYQTIFVSNFEGSVLKNTIKKILRCVYPYDRISFLEKTESLLIGLKKGNYISNIFGRWKEKECVPENWYGEWKRYSFEDYQFCGLQEYDKYLTQMYGDYMKLPPIEKQKAHVENVFIK